MRSRNFGRFFQPAGARERAATVQRSPSPPIEGPTLPARIGPVEFIMLGGMIAARYPQELVQLVQKAGGIWEPGSRRWLVERWRINPLIRHLRRATDPLSRQVGMELDEE